MLLVKEKRHILSKTVHILWRFQYSLNVIIKQLLRPPKYFNNYQISLTVNMCVQLCLTFCGPMDCSPPGSSVYGILQGKNPGEGFHFHSRGSSQPRDQTGVSCVSCIGSNSLPLVYLGSQVEKENMLAKWRILNIISLL